jgi:hypothetical protein
VSYKDSKPLKKHKLVTDGRTLEFSLPSDYSTSYIVDREKEYDEEESIRFIYNTPLNRNNYLKILCFITTTDTPFAPIDSFANKFFLIAKPYSVVWSERKEENGNPHYFLIDLYRDAFYDEIGELSFRDSVYSRLMYVMDYDTVCYMIDIFSKEHIKDFSYEEKYEILESIQIK